MLKGWRFLGVVNGVSIYQQNKRYVGIVTKTIEPQPVVGYIPIFDSVNLEKELSRQVGYITIFDFVDLEKEIEEFGYSYIGIPDYVVLTCVRNILDSEYISVSNSNNLYLMSDNEFKYINLYNRVTLNVDKDWEYYKNIYIFNTVSLSIGEDESTSYISIFDKVSLSFDENYIPPEIPNPPVGDYYVGASSSYNVSNGGF